MLGWMLRVFPVLPVLPFLLGGEGFLLLLLLFVCVVIFSNFDFFSQILGPEWGVPVAIVLSIVVAAIRIACQPNGRAYFLKSAQSILLLLRSANMFTTGTALAIGLVLVGLAYGVCAP